MSYYSSRRAAELRRKNRLGAAMLAATVLGFAGMFYGAAAIDASNGITVSESLANHGMGGGAAIARAFESEASAVDARLIGYCGGRIMAADSESAFPASGCAWIETPADAAPKLAALGASDHGAAELTGRLVAEMDSAGCSFSHDGAAEYTLESCK